MDTTNRDWNVLCWNIRGINASEKWEAVRNKVEESSCSILCIQETKRQTFDLPYIRNFVPRRFDCYEFVPSMGASGGILIIWNSSIFKGEVIDKQQFGITVRFTSMHNGDSWKLTNVYGPCVEPRRSAFISWFRGHNISDDENWMFLGDFNFYRSLENRNKPGGNINDTMIFNDAIGHLGLVELPLKGRAFTWSNMQDNPLLEQLDWFFTSVNWTIDFPSTEVLPLAKITSDHIPCRISIGTRIPKANIFRLENYWMEQHDFLQVVQNCWSSGANHLDMAKNLAAKFKKLRATLKKWSKGISNLNWLISNCNQAILIIDNIEEQRELFNPEKNFRIVVKRQLSKWLTCKRVYWKNRYTVNRIKFGDECTKFFHGMATISFRRNSILQHRNEQRA